MGLDVSFGIAYGVFLEEIAKDFSKKEDVIRYDQITGKRIPGLTKEVCYFRFNIDFGPYKKDQEVLERDVIFFVDHLQGANPFTGNWVCDEYHTFIGYKSFKGKTFYGKAQDVAIPFIPTLLEAKAEFEKVFGTELPAKEFLFLLASY